MKNLYSKFVSTPVSQSLDRTIRYTATHLLLASVWLLSAFAGLLALLTGSSWFKAALGISSFVFIVLLIWVLSRQKPAAADLPGIDFLLTPRISYAAAFVLLVGGLVILFFFGIMAGLALSILVVSALIGLVISVAWRNQVTPNAAILGVSAGLIAAAGTAFLANGDLSWALANLLTIPPVFVGGALLINRTGLAHFHLIEGRYFAGLRGFLGGCLLAIPASLLNLLGNMEGSDTWINQWWEAFYAIVPGIAEETGRAGS